MTAARAYTAEEVRQQFIDHVRVPKVSSRERGENIRMVRRLRDAARGGE